jgi:hypothetical protein
VLLVGFIIKYVTMQHGHMNVKHHFLSVYHNFYKQLNTPKMGAWGGVVVKALRY